MNTPHVEPPKLWRLSEAARMVGLSPEVLASAIERGEIPTGMHRIAGFRYVNGGRLMAWFAAQEQASSTPPAEGAQ